MNLKSYLSSLERGASSRIASSLGISISYLSQMASGKSPISAARCVAIEQATHGAVTRRDIRPDDYWQIWPEIDDRLSERGAEKVIPIPIPMRLHDNSEAREQVAFTEKKVGAFIAGNNG